MLHRCDLPCDLLGAAIATLNGASPLFRFYLVRSKHEASACPTDDGPKGRHRDPRRACAHHYRRLIFLADRLRARSSLCMLAARCSASDCRLRSGKVMGVLRSSGGRSERALFDSSQFEDSRTDQYFARRTRRCKPGSSRRIGLRRFRGTHRAHCSFKPDELFTSRSRESII